MTQMDIHRFYSVLLRLPDTTLMKKLWETAHQVGRQCAP